MKKTLLKVMGVALAIGCAPAGAVDPTNPPSVVTPAARQQTFVASAIELATQGTSIGLAHAGTLQLPSDANGTASSLNGSQIALAMVPVPGSFSSRSSGAVDGQQGGGGSLVSVAAVPEPSGGAMLLCGLAVLAFIARRKTQSLVD